MRMKSIVLAMGLTLTAASPAVADPLDAIKAFTLNDVKTAETIYAANPTVPTYTAATQCLGYLDSTLSAPNAPVTFGELSAPQGVISAVADLDVAVNSVNNGLPPVVLAFNQNCGAYVEDLKAEAAAHALITIFGVKLL